MSTEPTSTPLWSQFLRRLGSSEEEPISPQVVLEVVLTLDKEFPLRSTALRRIGSLVSDSLPSCLVLVGHQVSLSSELTIFYGNCSTAQARSYWKQLSNEGVFTHKHTQGNLSSEIKSSSLGSLKRWYRIEVPESYLVIVSEESINKTEWQLLRLINRLVARRRNHHKLDQEYENQTKQLNTLIHHLSEGLAILGPNLEIQVWNRPLQRLTGYSPLEAQGQPVHQFLFQPKSPQWLEELSKEHQSPSSRQVFQCEAELQTKQHKSIWVNISGSFLHATNQGITQTIMLISDISRHKELENRKNEFISIATHELRTPITAIKGYLSLLRNTAKDELSAKPLAYLERAQQANDRLTHLSEELLQAVQVEENRVRFNIKPLNLSALVSKVAADLQEKATAKNLQLTIEQPEFDTIIAADFGRLEQVFGNLIDNAIKYTKEGTVTIRFEKTTNPVTKELAIASHIIDTGIGLSSKELPAIFEKFHRTTEARASNESGAGLGLFIVKNFIEKQGGTISVKSSFRRGSQFTVSFPAVERKTE